MVDCYVAGVICCCGVYVFAVYASDVWVYHAELIGFFLRVVKHKAKTQLYLKTEYIIILTLGCQEGGLFMCTCHIKRTTFT